MAVAAAVDEVVDGEAAEGAVTHHRAVLQVVAAGFQMTTDSVTDTSMTWQTTQVVGPIQRTAYRTCRTPLLTSRKNSDASTASATTHRDRPRQANVVKSEYVRTNPIWLCGRATVTSSTRTAQRWLIAMRDRQS